MYGSSRSQVADHPFTRMLPDLPMIGKQRRSGVAAGSVDGLSLGIQGLLWEVRPPGVTRMWMESALLRHFFQDSESFFGSLLHAPTAIRHSQQQVIDRSITADFPERKYR